MANGVEGKPLTMTPALWSLLGLYALARFLPLFKDRIPVPVIAAFHIFPPLLFALLHGASVLGRRAILTFFTVFLLVGNSIFTMGPFALLAWLRLADRDAEPSLP
jgi:hypothetical protein